MGVADALRICLLGPPAWVCGGRQGRFKRKDAALLAILAVKGVQQRDALAQLLWPEIDPALAATNLRQRVYRLRRETGHELVVAGATVDLARGVHVDQQQRLADLALDELLERGEFLAGLAYPELVRLADWVAQERARQRRDLVDALSGHAALMEKRGELAAALALGERIVALLPAHEIGWRRQMRLHYLRGDRAAALDAFERFENIVADELGMRPSDETLELLQTIERATTVPIRRGVLPASLIRPPMLIGREQAWLAMTRAWSAGRPFMLLGEAGIGKSRLLADYLGAAGGVVCVEGRPGDEHAPYSVLARALRAVMKSLRVEPEAFTRHELGRILPDLGAPAAASAGRQATLWLAVETFLLDAVRAGLRVLAVDDLQSADVASVESLRWLASSRGLVALRFAFATRPVQSAAARAVIDDWLVDSQRPELIELPRLSQAEVTALIDSLGVRELAAAALGKTLYARAGGHPFFSLETLKDHVLRRADADADGDGDADAGGDGDGVALGVPSSARPLLERRLRDLPASATPLLRLAAVMGGDLTPARAAAALSCDAAEVDAVLSALQSAQVFRASAFVHDLLRECALEQIAAPERRLIHAAAARVLDEDDAVPPGRLAFHWEQAQRWPQAGASLHAAAMAARLSGRLDEQKTLLERSAACWERAGDGGAQFDVLHDGMEGALLRFGPEGVLAELPRLERLADTPVRELKTLMLRAESLAHRVHGAEAAVLSVEAVRRAERHPELLADALAIHGTALAQSGLIDEAVDAHRRGVEAAERAGSAQQALRVMHTQIYILFQAGRIGDAILAARKAARLTRASADLVEQAQVEGNLGVLLSLAGHLSESHDTAVRVRRTHDVMGSSTNGILGGMNLLTLGTTAAYFGRFDEALEALDAATHVLGDGTPVAARAKARIAAANLWLALGACDEARAAMAPLTDDVPPAMQVQWHWAQARIARMADAPDVAHLQRMAQIQADNADLSLVQCAWLEWSRQGDAQRVIERLERAQRECEDMGLPGTARAMRLRRIDRLLDLHDASALQHAGELAAELQPEIAQGLHATIYLPEALWTLARALRHVDREARARGCIDEARRWIEASMNHHVPHAYRHSFLTRNPVNRLVMQGGSAVTP